ncbi:MAG: response regulator [Deltaproteobacteria bacterium]|nr:response regulator [Deltaproteobacteria bacterium]
MALALPNESSSSQQPKRVVVVDDNEILLRAWRKILDKQECQTFITSDPFEALSYLTSNGVDILIADVVMPYMDGFELIQKAQASFPQLRIILTTGYVCDFQKIKLHVETPDIHVLLKPYNDIQQIRKFLTRVLEDDDTLDTEDSFKNPDDIRIHLWAL